jgi:hypothetical protein
MEEEIVLHRAPSAGAVIKKILDIHPDMGTHEMIALMRQCSRRRGATANEFASAEIIDEEKALRLARESVARLGSR